MIILQHQKSYNMNKKWYKFILPLIITLISAIVPNSSGSIIIKAVNSTTTVNNQVVINGPVIINYITLKGDSTQKIDGR